MYVEAKKICLSIDNLKGESARALIDRNEGK
jgi:hypothetical protein